MYELNLPMLKAEDPAAYKKLAEKGIMVAHHVTINGQTARPDIGIGYHATVKFFDPEKDHPEAIHEVARGLKFPVPDPETTGITPTTFKDRFGNDVYVLKLHGEHADAIKENNSKFSHMGHPTSYEFTPHISLDQHTWNSIVDSGAKTAKEAGIEFGHAQLKQGPKVLTTYKHGGTSAAAAQPERKLAASEKTEFTLIKTWGNSDRDAIAFHAEHGFKPTDEQVTNWKKTRNIKPLVPAPNQNTYKELDLNHGTKSPDNFSHFDMKHHQSGFYPGVYTTTDPEYAKTFGRNINVKFKGHVFEITGPHHAAQLQTAIDGGASGHNVATYLKQAGYHAIKRGHEHIILDPANAQITKSEKMIGQPLAKGQNGDWQKEGYYLRHIKSQHEREGFTTHMFHAFSANGEKVGNYEFIHHDGHNELFPNNTATRPLHQRKGLASAAYALAEKHTGMKLSKPRDDLRNPNSVDNSGSQSSDAKALWAQKNRQFGKSEDLQPLEKGLKQSVTAAAMASMIGLASPTAANPSSEVPQQASYQSKYDSGKMLRTIASVESSGGKFTNHRMINGHPDGDQAFGKYGLMPNTIRETIHMNRDLKSKYGKAANLDGADLHHFMQDNPGLEDQIATKHLARLEHHFGKDPAKLGYAWLNGVAGTYKAGKENKDINSHWHVLKIKNAYGKQ